MRAIVILSAMVLPLHAVTAAAAENSALTPSGKWTINYEPTSCVASREFSSPMGTITLAITPGALNDGAEIAVIVPDAGTQPNVSDHAGASIGGTITDVAFTAASYPQNKLRIARSYPEQQEFKRIAAAPTITMPLSMDQRFTFPIAGVTAAMKATDTCRADLRKLWKIDADAFARIATPAVAIRPETWIEADDYPTGALNAMAGGKTTIVWTIGTSGRVSNCRAVESAGRADLDNAACAAITKRGRYQPALDTKGKPVIGYGMRVVRWQMPG